MVVIDSGASLERLAVERFSYSRVSGEWGDWAVLELLAVVAAGPSGPVGAHLVVAPVASGDDLVYAPAAECQVERRLMSAGPGAYEQLWSATFSLPLAVVETPGALFTLVAGGSLASALSLPVPQLCDPVGHALDLGRILPRERSQPVLNARRLAAVASTVAVAAVATPAVAMGATGGGAATTSTPVAPIVAPAAVPATSPTSTAAPVPAATTSTTSTTSAPAAAPVPPAAPAAPAPTSPAPAPAPAPLRGDGTRLSGAHAESRSSPPTRPRGQPGGCHGRGRRSLRCGSDHRPSGTGRSRHLGQAADLSPRAHLGKDQARQPGSAHHAAEVAVAASQPSPGGRRQPHTDRVCDQRHDRSHRVCGVRTADALHRRRPYHLPHHASPP